MDHSKMTSLAEGVPQISNKKNTMVKEGCPKKIDVTAQNKFAWSLDKTLQFRL